MATADKLVYTAKVHTTGGRDGASTSSDGNLDVKLVTPGSSRAGTTQSSYLPQGGRRAS